MKSKATAGILALLLGGLGTHKFYIGDKKMGFIYLIFFWTYIPAILGIIDGIKILNAGDAEFENMCKFTDQNESNFSHREMPQKSEKNSSYDEDDEKADFIAVGCNSKILVLGKKIVIKRKGVMNFALHGIKGDKSIPIKNITSMQFKKATYTMRGYLQFSILGSYEDKGGILNATSDENTILFDKSGQSSFEKLQAHIEELIL